MNFEGFQQFAGGIPNQFKSFNDFSDLQNTINQGAQAQGNELQYGAEQLFRARAEGIGGNFREYSRGLGSTLASQGVDPGFAQRMIAERGAVVPEQIAMARGETQAGLAQQRAGILGQQTESLVSLGVQQKQMAFQDFLARKARKDGRKAGIANLISGGVGLGINTLGLFGLGGKGPFSFLGGAGGGGGQQ